MGKRIVRLQSFDSQAEIMNLVGREVAVILRNSGVWQGEIERAVADGLILRDKRFVQHTIRFCDIQEIQYDFTSEY